MGYASKVRAITERVELSNGYSANIGLLSKQDNDACRAALLGGSKTTGKYEAEDNKPGRTTVDQSLDDAAYVRALLARGIKSWDLDDDNGQILPVNEQTVEILSGPDSDALVKAIKALNGGISKDDKSPADAAGGASA